ncbi:MAG: cereblon family protein [Endozoicomonas sp.]
METQVLTGLYRTRQREQGHASLSNGQPDQASDAETADEDGNSGKKLLCRRCRNPVTSSGHSITIAGSQSHSQCNPSGRFFYFTCFSQAPGCAVFGEATAEFSWFPGYRWQYACCGKCDSHLGWFFSGYEPTFFGLLENELTEQCE